MTHIEKEIAATKKALALYDDADMEVYQDFVNELKQHLKLMISKLPQTFTQESFI